MTEDRTIAVSEARTGVYRFLSPMHDWRCPSCGVRLSVSDSSARWNGREWEHKCAGQHPQAGYTETYYHPPVYKGAR
jgi:hypothetical protein